jgi:hypothetical protein
MSLWRTMITRADREAPTPSTGVEGPSVKVPPNPEIKFALTCWLARSGAHAMALEHIRHVRSLELWDAFFGDGYAQFTSLDLPTFPAEEDLERMPPAVFEENTRQSLLMIALSC